MKLKKVISGGQTGADRTSLECAKAIGLETGGTAPKGYRTETGDDPSLKDFGLVESPYRTYPPRTQANVKDSEATLWFGNVGSPGYWCTVNAAVHHQKGFFINPNVEQMKHIADTFEVINVAGNRKSTNPKVVGLVQDAFKGLEK